MGLCSALCYADLPASSERSWNNTAQMLRFTSPKKLFFSVVGTASRTGPDTRRWAMAEELMGLGLGAPEVRGRNTEQNLPVVLTGHKYRRRGLPLERPCIVVVLLWLGLTIGLYGYGCSNCGFSKIYWHGKKKKNSRSVYKKHILIILTQNIVFHFSELLTIAPERL